MKKGVIIGIVIVVLILAIGAFFLFGKNYSGNGVTTTPTTVQNNPQSQGGGAGQTNSIEIKNFAFSPATLNIKKGQTVTWTNQDNSKHKIISDSGSEISSPEFAKGESFQHTFNTIGEFSYHCSIHPSMKGKVVVAQ